MKYVITNITWRGFEEKEFSTLREAKAFVNPIYGTIEWKKGNSTGIYHNNVHYIYGKTIRIDGRRVQCCRKL